MHAHDRLGRGLSAAYEPPPNRSRARAGNSPQWVSVKLATPGAELAINAIEDLCRRAPPNDCAWVDELLLAWSRLPVAKSAIGRALSRGAGVWDSGMREQTARSFTRGEEWLRPSTRTGVFVADVYRRAVELASDAPVLREWHIVGALAAASPQAFGTLSIDADRFRATVEEYEEEDTDIATARPSADARGRTDASALIHRQVWDAAGHAFEGGKWDDAIFDAMRIVEAALQERLSSKKIGDDLVKEAFVLHGAPRVRISTDALDNKRLEQSFSGALGYLKGARSHGEAPAVPCPSREMCERALVVASFLLAQIELDQAIAPEIVALRPDGAEAFEIETVRAERAEVLVDGTRAKVLARAGNVLRVALKEGGPHQVVLVDGPRRSATVTLEAEPKVEDANFHLVAAVDLPLFEDDAGTLRRPETAVRLLSYEGRRYARYFPAGRDDFVAGEYVDWSWDSPIMVAESWVRDEGELRYAWTSSMGFSGRRVGQSGSPRLARIEIRPTALRVRPGDMCPLRVVGYFRDGPACWREDLTATARLECTDTRVAYVDDRRKTLRAKTSGDTRLRARVGQLFDEIPIRVAALARGEVVEFVGGIRRMVRLAYGPDGLLIANQSDRLLLVSPDGAIKDIARLDMPRTAATGMDYLAVNPDGDVFVRVPWLGAVVRVDRSSGFNQTELVHRSPQRQALSAVAWSEHLGGLVIGDSEGQLSVWRAGKVEIWAKVSSFVTDIAVTEHGLLVTTARSGPGYSRVDWNGAVSVIALPLGQTDTTAIAARGDEVIVADFNTGQVIGCQADSIAVLAERLQNPGGLAVGPDGSLFIANFGGDSISRVLP